MYKIFLVLFLYFFIILNISAYEKPEIISRKEWGADETYTYLDGIAWKNILETWEKNSKKPKKKQTPYEKFITQKKIDADRFIALNFSKFLEISSEINDENNHKLAWPISYSTKIRAITIHHTEAEYKDTITGLNQIYRYHALNREWGDIGYNFLIGYNGKIYEGRKGGEMSVGAHVKYNNTQNIGISILGNYDEKDISIEQYRSLEKLVRYLVEKYKIDVTKKQPFFKKCFTKECREAISVNYEYPIIGHRDAGITDCPGDILYEDIKNIRAKILIEQINFNNSKKKYFPVFDKISEEKLLELSEKIEKYLNKGNNKQIKKIGKLLKVYLQEKKS